MQIKQIVLYKIEIPMVASFTTSFGTIKRKPMVLVKVKTADGLVGWGESAALPFPFYSPETPDTCMLVLKDYIAPLVLNKNFKSISEVMATLRTVKGNNFAKTGLETALWMILSLKKNKPLKEILGGTRAKIAVGESIGIHPSVKETLEEIQLRLHQGFRRIKVKIKPGWDVKLVKKIRQKFPKIDLMVDANSSYTLKDINILKKLDHYDLTMMEQPLADDDIVDHSILQKQLKTPICLDESIHSVDDARRAIYLNACKIINIKPGRVGGLLESIKIHDLCKKNKIGVWCGGMLESGIGRAFNIAVASLSNFSYPADMSPIKFFYKDDLVNDSFVVDKEGYIQLPQKPGLGFEINERKIKKYTSKTKKLC